MTQPLGFWGSGGRKEKWPRRLNSRSSDDIRVSRGPRTVCPCGFLTQSSLCDPVDRSPPRSSVHGVLQARILEWVAISFSRGSFQLRDGTQVSCIAGRFSTIWAMREAQRKSGLKKGSPDKANSNIIRVGFLHVSSISLLSFSLSLLITYYNICYNIYVFIYLVTYMLSVNLRRHWVWNPSIQCKTL